jgi:hypothetical protein
MSTVTEKTKEELKHLIEDLVKNIEEMTKLEVYLDTKISTNKETTGYYWNKLNKDLKSINDFSDNERQLIENICDLSSALMTQYEIIFVSSIDENNKPFNIDKVKYGFMTRKKDKYDPILVTILNENRYSTPLHHFSI